jgi:hypothetical protein
MCIPGSGSSSGGGGGAILLAPCCACFESRRPPAFNAPVDGWLLCAHSVVHRPHPRCLCPTPRRCCCPCARLCPVRTTTTADPPPEVGKDCPLDAPDVNAHSPSRPPRSSSPPAASDAPLAPRDIIGRRRRQRPRSVSVNFVVVVVKRRGGEGDGRARDGRRQQPTMPAPSNDDKGVLGRERGLFTGGDSVLPHQGHNWSRSCPKSFIVHGILRDLAYNLPRETHKR